MPDFRCEFERHAVELLPAEACGLVVSGCYLPCRNIAENPEQDFVLDPRDYARAALTGTIEAVVHSHPMGAGASEADLKACKYLGVPWHIWAVPEDEWSTINP